MKPTDTAVDPLRNHPDILWRIETLCRQLGTSKPSVYKYLKLGLFPKPIRLFPGSRSVYWRKADILAWVDHQTKLVIEEKTHEGTRGQK
jgi:predicted DNA-binding transcriptional regulator AlpA